MDETTDVEQWQYIAYLVFGIVGVESEHAKCYLANIAVLQAVNPSTIAAFINDSLDIIWPGQILYCNILLSVNDAVPYMVKAVNGMKV